MPDLPPGAVSVEEAARVTRTGDLWLFRGRTAADRAIQTLTNSPVNHVGMAVVIDDLPPLMWHAELGLAGVAGVVATGAVVARHERERRAYTPDEIRARLHQRYAEIGEQEHGQSEEP